MRLSLAFAVTALLLCPLSARAQDEPKVGVTMGYPSAVGVLWRVADRVALRPEFTWTRTSFEVPAFSDPLLGTVSPASTSDSWQTGTGVSALFYLSRFENLRTYVSPRFSYSYSSSSSGLPNTAASSSSDVWAYTTSGAFGAQYGLGRHFGLFGEIGLNYTWSTTRSSLVESRTVLVGVGPGGPITSTTTMTIRTDQQSHTVATRSGAGVIFFF
jgi:hypothetical protein